MRGTDPTPSPRCWTVPQGPKDVTGLILAGGEGRRMGGVDKGWVLWHDRPLVVWVQERLRPQVGSLLISANRSLERYAALGLPVVRDDVPGFAGPLAGIAAGLAAAPTDWLVTAPCDSPLLPRDLVARFRSALSFDAFADQASPAASFSSEMAAPSSVSLARGGEGNGNGRGEAFDLPPVLVAHDGVRAHPVFLLLHRAHLPSLRAFLASGRRKIDAWFEALPHRFVAFPDPQAFANANTPAELAALPLPEVDAL